MANGAVIGDDSCELAFNGECNDGGPGSLYYTDESGKERAACPYATDRTDCEKAVGGGLRTMTTLGALSYAGSGNPKPPFPTPPPAPPTPHSDDQMLEALRQLLSSAGMSVVWLDSAVFGDPEKTRASYNL